MSIQGDRGIVLLLGSTEGGESAARLEGMCGIDGTVTAAWLSVRGECKFPLDGRDRCHCNWSKKKSGSICFEGKNLEQ